MFALTSELSYTWSWMYNRNMQNRKPTRETQRKRVGNRMLVACINCKDRKLRCDDQVPACANCKRFNLVCLVEDPATKRRQPRNYLETLEERVAQLEETLRRQKDLDQNPSISLPQSNCQDFNLSSTGKGRDAIQTRGSNTPQTSQDGAEVGDLAAKLGMLSVAAGAEPHYLGQSSAVAFSRVINSVLLQSIPRKERSTMGAADAVTDDSVLGHCLLPSAQDCMKLSDAYFQHINPQYPFLHEPTFRNWEMKLMPVDGNDGWDLNATSLFFLYMVYAIGALLLPDLGYSPEQLFSTSQLYVDSVLQLENLETIQAYLCFALYSIRSPAGTSVWRFSGLALRQCIELGYHRSQSVLGVSLDPLRVELRKRVFWSSFAIDSMACCILGRPLALRKQEIDCEFPLDVEDLYISSQGIMVEPRQRGEPPTAITKGIETFRVRLLWGQIHASLYSDISASSPSHPTYQARTAELRKDLEAWKASLPAIVVPHLGDTLSVFSSDWWYEMCYCYTILYLYRGQLTDTSKPATQEALFESVKAAEEMCHGLRNLILSRKTTYTWGALHSVFIAGLTYLHCLWVSSEVRQATRQDAVSSTCTDCTIVLVLMAQWHEAVEPYRDTFEALASRTMKMLTEAPVAADTASGHVATVQQADRVDSADLMQWIADISDGGMSHYFGDLLTGLVNEMPPKESGNLESSTGFDE